MSVGAVDGGDTLIGLGSSLPCMVFTSEDHDALSDAGGDNSVLIMFGGITIGIDIPIPIGGQNGAVCIIGYGIGIPGGKTGAGRGIANLAKALGSPVGTTNGKGKPCMSGGVTGGGEGDTRLSDAATCSSPSIFAPDLSTFSWIGDVPFG